MSPNIDEQYDPDRTILTLSFAEKQATKTSGKNKRQKQAGTSKHSKTQANKQKIEEYILKNSSGKTSKLANYLNLSEQRTRVLVSELIAEGRIRAEGESRARRYVLTN